MSIPSIFDKQFKLLLLELKEHTYDHKKANDNISKSLTRYSLRKILPDTYIIKNFDIYIRKPYGDEILNNNEDYFIKNNNYTVENYKNNGTILYMTQVFKEIWCHITDYDKESIKIRMQILIKLCDKWNMNS